MMVILTSKHGSLEWLLPGSTVGLTGRHGDSSYGHPYEHVKKASRFGPYGAMLHSIRSHVSSRGERKTVVYT